MKGAEAMQVSGDVAVDFIGARVGQTNDGHAWYRISIRDEKQDILNFYCEPECYSKLQGCNIGDRLQLVLDVHGGRNGTVTRLIDAIKG